MNTEGKKHNFSIVHQGGKLHVSANCQELKTVWLSALQKAILDAKLRSRPLEVTEHAFVGHGTTSQVSKVQDGLGWACEARELQSTVPEKLVPAGNAPPIQNAQTPAPGATQYHILLSERCGCVGSRCVWGGFLWKVTPCRVLSTSPVFGGHAPP